MGEISIARRLVVVAACVAMGVVSGCGGDDGGSGAGGTTAAPDETSTTVDDAWRGEAQAHCDAAASGAAAIAPPSSPDDVTRYIEDFVALHDELAPLQPTDLPPELTEPPTDLPALFAEGDEWVDLAVDHLAAGNVDGTEFSDTAHGSIDRYIYGMGEVATVMALAGIPCGPADPSLASEADLNVPISTAWQVETGFDSVWVSQEVDDAVVRIDPETGEEQAVVDVGARPAKLQPADGRMIVRTDDAYVAIDPETDTVTDRLAKADVGPSANRSWAIDGALWICDGTRLHRYDPATFEPVTTVDLGFDCGQVHATDDLVVAWTYDEDEAESGASVAAFVDPTTDAIVETVELPVDVNVPVVLDDAVYFPPNRGTSRPVVVDRTDWSVSSAPELTSGLTGGQPAVDGTSIYVVDDKRSVAVVDPTTFEVIDTIPAFDFTAPLGGNVNSVAVGSGALWVVNDEASLLQRFDRPE